MIRLRFAATLVAAAFAGCLAYFVMPLARVDTDQRLPATMPTLTGRTELLAPDIGQHLAAEQQAAAAFERAAKTILKRLPDAMWHMQAPMSHQSPGISLCQRGAQSRGDSRPLLRFSLRPASGSEGVQCVGNENSYAQNNEKCGNNLEHRRTLRNRSTN